MNASINSSIVVSRTPLSTSASCYPPVENDWKQEAKVSIEVNILAVFILGYICQHLENLFLKNLDYLQFYICLPPSLATDGPAL